MTVIDVPHGSPAWHDARLGIPTASEFGAVVECRPGEQLSARTTKTALKARATYAHKLVAERLAGAAPAYVNAAMERGLSLEPEVLQRYRARLDEPAIEQPGFVLDDSGLWGCSPDGLVGDDGLVEVKTTAPHLFVGDLLSGDEVPARFRAQMVGQMLTCGRAWCDLAQYSAPLDALRVCRLEALPAELELLEAELREFARELDEMEAQVLDLLSEFSGDAQEAAG